MPEWNLADVWEVAAEVVPDRVVQKCGARTLTWEQFDRRANALSADLLASGLPHQAKVAAYLYNGVEYLEVYAAALKAGMVPVNTNYRYGATEVAYLFDNADAEAVVFHACFAPLLEQVREGLPKVVRWYVVDDGSPSVTWATPYEAVVAAGADRSVAPWGRSPDDLLLLYTGGTTGLPKGVMWRQDDLFMVLGAGGNPILGIPPAESLADIRTRIAASVGAPLVKALPACPLMHGTGQFSSFLALNSGGCVVTMPERTFSPARLWQTVQDEKITGVVIVGDAFARPMLAELDAHPAYDLSTLLAITSSGVMWSQEVKAGLAKHLPNTILFDSLGSSEAVGVAVSVSGGALGSPSGTGPRAGTASFSLLPGAKVFVEDGREVQAGSGEIGMLGLPGHLPVGYYKDPVKSASTFRVIDGVRYSLPGDFATVADDGGIHLLGRGSVVINTGGEKVFPEEVEEVLKQHPAVRDAVCVGVPDERFGEAICAVVEVEGATTLNADEVIEHVRARLAHYKAPRRVITVDSIGRSPAGKVDYKALQRLARGQLHS
jgi:fatty-acyl-CoA synthase